MKRLSLVLSLVCFAAVFAMAQRTVVGTVSDDGGETLIGASVQAKGTNAGTVTDVNGKFSLAVPREATTLIVSYTGYTTQEIALGASNVVDVRLASGKLLTEVVVSATGLTRNKSEVVYANQTVSSEDLNAVTNKSVLNALQGKTAGVKIGSASGQAGASTRIVLRGETSLTQGNNALIVVDGVPMNNSSASAGGGTGKNGSRDNYVDFGNRGNDINPDDIESVTVLKGPAATTLYGSRGGSGVVLITTKKGKKGDKANINISSSISSDKAYLIWKPQEKWGSGYGSCGGCQGSTKWFMGENFAWGPEFNGQLIPWTSQPVDSHGDPIPLSNGKIEQLVRPYSAVKNNFQNFFDIGSTFRNNVSIDGGNDKTTYFLGYTNFTNKGVIPHNFFNKHNVMLNVGSKFSDKLRSDFSLNYVKVEQRGATEGGYPFGFGSGTPSMAFATQTPANIPFRELRDYNSPYHDFKGFYGQYSVNPYYILDKQDVRNTVDNVISSVSVQYAVNRHFALTGKVSTNFINSVVTEKGPKFGYERAFTWSDGNLVDGGREPVGTGSLGSYKESAQRIINMTYDVFGTYTRQLSDDFKLSTLVGLNSIDQDERLVSGETVGGLVLPEFYDLTNSIQSPLSKNTAYKYRLWGSYINNSLGFRDFLFLEYSARKDYSSTLPTGKRGFFYQGGGISFVPTRLPEFAVEQVSNIKIRGGLGSAGKDAPAYRLDTYYELNPNIFGTGNYQIRFPFNAQPGARQNQRIGNPNLKPELSVTSEVGVDLGFFQDRIELEYTYYNINSKNQIVDVNIPWSSGFAVVPQNIGRMVNKGHEVALRLTPIRNSMMKWNLFGTWSQNKNIVKTILDNGENTDELTIYNGLVQFTGHGSMNLIAAEGQPFGTYKGTNFVKDDQGRIKVDSKGNPLKSDELEYLGSYQPDWIGSLGTSINVKGFQISALLDGRKGGKFFSGTKVSTEFNGTASTTDIANRDRFVVENSVNADGSTNTTKTQAYDYFKGAPASSFLVDASYVKLRELTFSYTLPKATIGGFKNITIGVFGKNLKFWLPSENVFADPEVGGVGGASDASGIETTTVPPAKSFGAEIRLNF